MSDIGGLAIVWAVMTLGNYIALVGGDCVDGRLSVKLLRAAPLAIVLSLTPLGWIIGTAIWIFPFVWVLALLLGDDF